LAPILRYLLKSLVELAVLSSMALGVFHDKNRL